MKRSLHIGINNYPGTENDLDGCVNDAMDWKAELHLRGFHWQDVLIDNGAFKQAITDAMADIVVATEPGDIAVITFSGHGTWVPDLNADEPDGRDEAICPYNISDGEVLTDDEIGEILAFRKDGSKIIMISDSCHSGSVNRMANSIQNKEHLRPKVKFLPPGIFTKPESILTVNHSNELKPKKIKSAVSHSLLLSACSDLEYSYDAWFDGRANGAFTYIALWCLKRLKADSTYLDWYNAIMEFLPSVYYPQTPQLEGSEEQKNWKIFDYQSGLFCGTL